MAPADEPSLPNTENRTPIVRSSEGVELYQDGEESIVLTSAAVRDGADGIRLSVDEFQSLAVDVRAELERSND